MLMGCDDLLNLTLNEFIHNYTVVSTIHGEYMGLVNDSTLYGIDDIYPLVEDYNFMKLCVDIKKGDVLNKEELLEMVKKSDDNVKYDDEVCGVVDDFGIK